MGRTLKMRRDTPSKTPRSCRYPDLVADHIDEDGLAKAFRTLGLIE